MKEQERKHIPITRKIKRFFVPAKGIQPHKLYPEEYFKQIWFSHKDIDNINFIADVKHTTKKQAAHLLNEWGLKYFIRTNLMKSISDPQSQEDIADGVRLRLTIRRLARKLGWNVNKLI